MSLAVATPAVLSAVPQNLEQYETLRAKSIELGESLGADQQLIDKTIGLLDQLQAFHPATAWEAPVVAELAVETGTVLANHYEGRAAVNLPFIWSTGLVHDIGKMDVGYDLVEASEQGRAWSIEQFMRMMGHSAAGGSRVREAGLDEVIARAVEENHSHQPNGRNYGVNPELNNTERITRDLVYLADYAIAMATRTNTFNQGFTPADKLNMCTSTGLFLFGEYSDGEALAQGINSRMTELLISSQLIAA